MLGSFACNMTFSLDVLYYRYLNFRNIMMQRECTFPMVDKNSWFIKEADGLLQYCSVQLLVGSNGLTCLNIKF